MSKRISSFPPVIDSHSKILILGSIPGVKSLEKQEYYGHPQNKFWKLMFDLLDEEETIIYTEKLALLNRHHIALWDVLDSCERKGSLDSEIKNEELNAIPDLLKDYPKIEVIFCNGAKSFRSLQKILGKSYSIPINLLPSTSPLHTISYDKKLEQWKMIKKHL